MAKKIYNIPEHKTVASTPGTPALGHSKIYPKSDNLWYSLDDTGVETLLGSSGPAEPVQIKIATSSSFATSDTIGGYGQDGKHIMIANGASPINITCNGSVTASYQVLGTGTVTFIAGSSRTLVAPSSAVINTQYGTATLSYDGTTDIVLVNNV